MSDEHKHEIVIIRRGGHGDHDEHHGGVWKIAFADFMTAMMAFFLVMWLISANDKTRASVARYFNPVRLVDATTQPRGLHDTKKDESGITASPGSKRAEDDKQAKPETTSKDAKDGKDAKEAKDAKGSPEAVEGKDDKKGAKETPVARDKRLDKALRDSPYTALAEIVAAKGPGGELPTTAPPAPAIGRRGGEAFRDPFAPPPPGAEGEPDTKEAALIPPSLATADPVTDDHKDDAKSRAAKKQDAKTDEAKKDEAKDETGKEEAKAVLAALKPQTGPDGPQVDVKRTDEGLLVSFTDTTTFAMFPNGSAVPARKLVLIMESVAKALRAHPGTVIVRGFTDNKPYRSGRYDNWHLSLDRAQVTHYMLVRGGFDDARIGHVEGYADRSAKPGTDPASPLNRRIEILMKDPQ